MTKGKAFSIVFGLGVGNALIAAFGGAEWGETASATYKQAVAVFACWLLGRSTPA